MKLQKLVDSEKGIDTYVLRINHKEATEAFKAMTPAQRLQIHDLQYSEQVSTLLKILTLWAEKVEETKEIPDRPKGHTGVIIHEG